MARIDCHFRDDGSYITLPDEWLGVHQMRRDEAIDKLADKNYPPVIHNFVVAMSMLTDWKLPGMPANPDEWDVKQTPINVMAWVWSEVNASFTLAYVIPKKKSGQSSNGQPEGMTRADGTLTAV